MMTETLSFLNWGFSPSESTGKFYLLTGGGAVAGEITAADAWDNHVACDDFKGIFSYLYEWVWSDYDYQIENPSDYIESDGDFLSGHNTQIEELRTKFSIPIWDDNGKYVRLEKINLDMTSIPIILLKTTLPYDSARWGNLDDADWSAYLRDSKKAYLDEFDKEYLTSYFQKLEALNEINSGNRLASIHIISLTYGSDYQCNKMNVSYLM